MSDIIVPSIMFLLFISFIFNVLWSGRKEIKKMNEDEQKQLEAQREHQNTLKAIIEELTTQFDNGNLEEILLYYTLENDNSVKRIYSFRVGRTLHCMKDEIDNWGKERQNQQN